MFAFKNKYLNEKSFLRVIKSYKNTDLVCSTTENFHKIYDFPQNEYLATSDVKMLWLFNSSSLAWFCLIFDFFGKHKESNSINSKEK